MDEEGARALPPALQGSHRARAAAAALTLAVACTACAEGATPSPRDECFATCFTTDPCEDAFCSAAGECLRIPSDAVSACRTDLHCDDGDACTTDTCELVAGCGFMRCRHRPMECGRSDPCTEVFCDSTSGCVTQPIGADTPCDEVADCDDGDICTTDTCEPVEACGLSVCRHVRPQVCVPCEQASDCDSCEAAQCIDGKCRFSVRAEGCDERCAPAASSVPGAGDSTRFRGFAAPVDTACPGDCDCARELILTLGRERLALVNAFDRPWGTCAVDVCEVETVVCEPLVAGRGYLVSGPRVTQVDDRSVGQVLEVDYFCLATHRELMVGRWSGTLMGEDGSPVIFEARVEPPGPASPPDTTTFVIDAPGTGWLTIPPQTFTLPDAAIRLETSLETSRGTYTGVLFSGPEALEGRLRSSVAGAPVAVLRLEPAP